MKHTYEVTDTITYERVWVVRAESEDAAIERVQRGDIEPDEEEQVDQTPYQAEMLTGE